MPLKQYDSNNNYIDTIYTKSELQEAVKKEREECALICDKLSNDDLDYTPLDCAEAIRKRGE